MIDLGREMARTVRVDWNASRIRAAEVGLRARRRQRAVARTSSIAIIAVAGLALALWTRATDERSADVASAPVLAVPAAPAIVATPSSPPSAATDTTAAVEASSDAQPVIATPDGAASRVHVVEHDRDRTVIELSGAARFEVAGPRQLRVVAGRTTITSYGAKFAAARFDQRVRVEVLEGFVYVASGDRERKLVAGEVAMFPPERARSRQRVRTEAVASWRELARRGDFDKAYAALAVPDAPPVRDVPDELLLAADVKRLSGHAAEAVELLRRIVRDHASDARAPLAAFTLGRVLLDLGRAREAASAFALAAALAPDGPLSEDALAREVEAAARSGDPARARRLAEQYLARYPDGRKERTVKRHGGLE